MNCAAETDANLSNEIARLVARERRSRLRLVLSVLLFLAVLVGLLLLVPTP